MSRPSKGGLRYGTPGRDRYDFSLALSHTRWRDIQADFLDSTGLPTTDNIGNGLIWSVAANVGWRPVKGLRFDASAAWNDGRVTEPSLAYTALLARFTVVNGSPAPGVITTPSGIITLPVSGGINRIPNVARFTAKIGADWQHQLRDELSLRVSAWGRYIGSSRLGVGPVLGAAQGNYVDSALTARIGTPRLGVTIGVTNLSDSVGNRFALGTPFATGRQQVTPLRPRTLRLGFDAAF